MKIQNHSHHRSLACLHRLRGIRTLPIILFSLACVFSACKRNETPPAPSAKVEIGTILTLTGPAGQIGQEMLNGQLLAKDFLAQNGTTLELDVQDSKAAPKDGIAALSAMRLKKLKCVVANGSGVALAIKPLFTSPDEALIAIAAHPKIADPPSPHVIMYSQTATDEGGVMVKWHLANKTDVKTAVVFHSADDYGQGVANAIKAALDPAGITVSLHAYRPEDAANMRNIVASAFKPDGSQMPYVVGTGQPMAQAMTVLRDGGYSGTIIVNIGYALTGVRQQLGAQAGKVAGTVLPVPKTVDQTWFSAQYKARYSKDPTPEAALGFNAIIFASRAIVATKGQSSPALGAAILREAGLPPDRSIIPVAVEIHEF